MCQISFADINLDPGINFRMTTNQKRPGYYPGRAIILTIGYFLIPASTKKHRCIIE